MRQAMRWYGSQIILANETDYGIHFSIFTSNLQAALSTADELEAAIV
ncbi:hypothetical protein [Bosea lathyri]|uniref:Uncharacterized protein n=1 Tax=Bosea lathyri TaxID=1036778 RepID=A0A1H6CAW9_9HYPH|nr:hypothetical protein [Bosea lathyri]SEG70111.1 hypothetical protein SAMN04488115_109208 [Bosea lathyri]